MPRPRRAATKAFAAPAADVDVDADPDFLALSARQRKLIDKAFEKGTRDSSGTSKKRKRGDDSSKEGSKLDIRVDDGGKGADGFEIDDDAGGGGFIDDGADGEGGGFIDGGDEANGGGGGFMLDDEDEDMGGFIPDDTVPSTSASSSKLPTRQSSPIRTSEQGQKARIPMAMIPGLLVSMGLPADEDVLTVFKASAQGWNDDDDGNNDNADDLTSRRKGNRGGGGETGGEGVVLKDWRAVCAALMGPEEDDQPGELGAGGDILESESEEEDTFELNGSESDSSLSAISSVSSTFDDTPKSKSKGKGKGSTTGQDSERGGGSGRGRKGKRKNQDLEENERIKLSGKQKEMVADIWKMVKPNLQAGSNKPGDRILGRDEVKVLVRSLGEMWTEDEITEMVTLFSTQNQGRGLSYDDFGAVMFRAGLV